MLNFLHTQAFFADVSKLLSGARPGSDAPLPGIVIASVLGFLTRVTIVEQSVSCEVNTMLFSTCIIIVVVWYGLFIPYHVWPLSVPDVLLSYKILYKNGKLVSERGL